MCSDFGSSMWLSFAPAQPDSLMQASAKRTSVAPTHSAVLPPLELPITATRFASSDGSVSIQSITRLAPQAQAEIVPHDSPSRSSSPGSSPIRT